MSGVSNISMPTFAEYAAENDKNKDNQFTKDELPEGPVKERFTQMDLDKDGIVTPAEWARTFPDPMWVNTEALTLLDLKPRA